MISTVPVIYVLHLHKTLVKQNPIILNFSVDQEAAETMSHYIINKQMASASSYIICPFPDFNWSIKSLATFGLARQVLIWVAYENNWQR